MRVVFMGTPEFACKPLEALCQSRHEVAAVVTGIDKQQGRGKKMSATAVCNTAECANLNIIKAESLKSDKLYVQLKELKSDLFIVIAFRILPMKLVDLPRIGAINIHASLLPRYRGAAPINWALINGEKETGLTSFFLKKTVDTGDIILQEKLTINPEENFDSLHNRLSNMSGEFLLKTIDIIESGNYELKIQEDSLTSPAPKISPFDAMIDFGFPPDKVVNFIRGMSTRPGAYSYYNGKKLKILKASKVENLPDHIKQGGKIRPGTVVWAKKQLMVMCADGAIELMRVQPDGKNVMDGVSFINGAHIKAGEIIGEIPQGEEKLIL